MALRDFFSFLTKSAGAMGPANRAASANRTSGPPTSSNAASSFHLWLDVPVEPLLSVSATIEVLEPPQVDRLFFWALQASFTKGSQKVGAGHFGLQHYSRHPGSGAVNWGGYFSGGGELPGSQSDLPSAAGNINTRDYLWEPNRQYRYKISPAGAEPNGVKRKGWQASVTDLSSGIETVVRDLHVDADGLTSPVVWTESFAHCDEPGVAVRWSDIEIVTRSGKLIRPESGTTNYQTVADGGCSNSTFELDSVGVIQRTGATRLVAGRQRIPLVQRS